MRVDNVIYTFYSQRQEFVSTTSRFRQWVLVAPECGEFCFATETECGTCRFGELVVVAPRGKFERSVQGAPLTYHVLQWDFQIDDAAFAEGLHPVDNVERLGSNFACLRPLLGRNDDWAMRRRENLLEELLLLACTTRQTPREDSDELMQRAAQLLSESAHRPFSMRVISDEVGLKPVQFTRRFRAAWGQAPIHYLTQIRLERAAKLLIETDWTLEVIARNCGYATPFYLSALFSKRFGQSPGQFRVKYRV